MTAGPSYCIGDTAITAVAETTHLTVPADWLLAGTDAASIAAERDWIGERWIEPATGQLIFAVQSLVVRTRHHTIVVDTCCGNQRDRGGSPFHMLDTAYLHRLRAAGVDSADVDFVMCTHLHSDHVGWNMQQTDGRWQPTFPNARYLMARSEFEYWADAVPRGIGSVGLRNAFAECVVPIVESGRARLLDAGQPLAHALDDTVRIESLAGHTPGHIGLHVHSAGAHALLTGDAFHHPVQFAHPHWGSPADVDAAAARATRARLIERYADSNSLIVPAHFDAGHIVRHGDGCRFHFAR